MLQTPGGLISDKMHHLVNLRQHNPAEHQVVPFERLIVNVAFVVSVFQHRNGQGDKVSWYQRDYKQSGGALSSSHSMMLYSRKTRWQLWLKPWIKQDVKRGATERNVQPLAALFCLYSSLSWFHGTFIILIHAQRSIKSGSSSSRRLFSAN